MLWITRATFLAVRGESYTCEEGKVQKEPCGAGLESEVST